MPRYTQADRPLRVDTVLDTDVLLLQAFSGHEAVSVPYHFTVDLLSEDPAVAAADLLRNPMLLTMYTPSGDRRFIHGIAKSFTELHRREDFTHYRAEIVPWFWFLSLTRDCRIFQNMTVLDIVEQVFGDLGLTNYDIRCTKDYPEREYCVQYRETSLAFVDRLLEEEGIFYFFEHTESDHTMVIADDNIEFRPCPHQENARMATEAAPDEDVVTSVERRHAVHEGAITLKDYDPLQPSLNLMHMALTEEGEEIYDYPGKFTELDEAERYAVLQLEERELQGLILTGESTCRAFTSGYRFELREHHRQDTNDQYVLTSVRHAASAGDYRSWDTATLDYSNQFVCIPHSVPYRPPQKTPKPRIRGTQTALVVGPSGEEIYVDRHGRIKVQFYWDRLGHGDENSSCWIRVATPWAGKGWGAISTPRIGNEVVVGFEEGDPDRPLIVGSVYNAEQVPPLSLPDDKTQLGIQTRSTKQGNPNTYNEVRFEDKKGEEQLLIHAEKDMSTSVENDQSLTVGGNRSVTVEKDETITVKGDTGRTITVTPGKSKTTVKSDIDMKSEKGQITVTADTKGIKLDAKVQGHLLGHDNVLIERDGAHCIEVKGGQVLLTCSGSTVDMGDSIITLTSSTIKLDASTIELKGGGGKITIDGSGVTIDGAMISSTAKGVHTLKGSIVKVN